MKKKGEKKLPPSPPQSKQNDIVLIFDGVYLSGRSNAVLIARTMQNVLSWHFAERESFEAWDVFLKQLSPPAVVVIDGQKGLLQAVLRRFPQTRIQRCLVHVERFVRMCLSRNPKTEAGRQLWALVRSLRNIQSRLEAETWAQQLSSWEAAFAVFLMERSRSTETVRWWYTHRKLRAARSHLKQSLPHLFTFTEVSGVSRTTNHVEGGVNARLKELVRRHRGLSTENKQVLTAQFFALKATQKPTRTVT
ncbi:MAG: transposase [Chlorobiaceae bacterium]